MAKLLSTLLKGTWNSVTSYTIGDIVTKNGSSYICIANNSNHTPPNATFWTLLAQAGIATGPGVSVDGEIVLFNGSSGNALKRATGSGYVKVASGVFTLIDKAVGADINTGTDDEKVVTPKAIADSNVAYLSDLPVKASGAEVATGTDDAKFATAKALADADLNTRLKSKTKLSTYNLATASGDVAITGIGFQPSAIICIANVDGTAGSFSIGAADSAKTVGNISRNNNTFFYDNAGVNALIGIDPGTGNISTAIVKSFDADGFTLTWTKGGTNTGIANLIFLCFR
jgi:hypothetical protein